MDCYAIAYRRMAAVQEFDITANPHPTALSDTPSATRRISRIYPDEFVVTKGWRP